MVGSPSKKSWRRWNIRGFLENYWWQTCSSPIQHEQSLCQHLYQFYQKTLIMQVCDRHANEQTALKRLGSELPVEKGGGAVQSLDRISKVYLDQHQKRKLKLKFHLYLSDSYHQNIKKIVTRVWESQKF